MRRVGPEEEAASRGAASRDWAWRWSRPSLASRRSQRRRLLAGLTQDEACREARGLKQERATTAARLKRAREAAMNWLKSGRLHWAVDVRSLRIGAARMIVLPVRCCYLRD